MDPYDYHLEKCGKEVFKTIEANRTHSSWPGMECGFMEEIVEDEEDVEEVVDIQELEYTDGSNEVVNFFNQKCVICLERDREYRLIQCGHQCICEECYQKKGDIDILKCVICRTQFF